MADNSIWTRQWMTQYLWNVGQLNLSQLCLPRSHDAGVSKLVRSSVGSNSNNTQTQTRSIYDQLCFGVRRFDIRPYLSYDQTNRIIDDWRCGHWSYDNNLKFVGSNGVSIKDLVNDVNRFTSNNPELIILEVSHISSILWSDDLPLLVHGAHPSPYYDTEEDDPSHYSQPTKEDWDLLFNELAGLQNLSRVTDSYDEAYKDNFLASRVLQDLITFKDGNDVKNKATVIVMVEGYPNTFVHGEETDSAMWNEKRRDLFDQHFLPLSALKNDDLVLCATASTADTISQTIGLGSIIDQARAFQNQEIPSAPQALLCPDVDDYKQKASRYGHNAISMDVIENTNLLTLALASSFFNHNAFYQPDQKLVVCYGGQMVANSQVLANVLNAVNQKQAFLVTNDSMGGDPCYGQAKICVVMWMDDEGRARGWYAPEGLGLPFDYRIYGVQYGTLSNQFTDVFRPSMYLKLVRVMHAKSSFIVSNDFVGWDPYPNQVKQLGIGYNWKGKDTTIQKQEGERLGFPDSDQAYPLNCEIM